MHSSIFFIYVCSMKIENTQSQMRKGILEYCILSILKNGEAYPSDIIEKLKTAKIDSSGRNALPPTYSLKKC